MQKETRYLSAVAILALMLSCVGLYYGYTASEQLTSLRQQVASAAAFNDLIKTEPTIARYLEAYKELGDVLVGATKEGKVYFYSSQVAAQTAELVNAFRKKYPFIEVEWMFLSTWELYNRFTAEQKAGKHLTDVVLYSGPGAMLRSISDGFIDPLPKDKETENFPTDVVDPQGRFVSIVQHWICPGVNTKLPKELWPKDWTDFLNPKPEWKSISIYDPRVAATGYALVYQIWKAYGEDKAAAFWKAIATMNPKFFTGTVPLMESLIAGEHLVTTCMVGYQYGPYVIDKKAPAELIVPTSGFGYTLDGTVGLVKGAPHPNAARLLIHFLLSKEAGDYYKTLYRYSTRKDATPPTGLPDVRGVKKLALMDDAEAERIRDELLAKWAKWMGL